MKNTTKLLGIIALVAIIGFSMVSCSDGSGGGGETSGTVWVSSYNYVSFRYVSESGPNCEVTTDLPAPNDRFTLKPTDYKYIGGLTPDKRVTFTAKVKEGSITKKIVGVEVGLYWN